MMTSLKPWQPVAVLASTLLVVLVCADRAVRSQEVSSAQKPVRETVGVVDGSPPPASLKGWLDASPVILQGTVESSRVIEKVRSLVGEDTQLRELFTIYTVRVTDVVKADAAKSADAVQPTIGGRLEVTVPGGAIDRGAHIQRQRMVGVPELRVGGNYFLTLAWHQGTWHTFFGEQATFEVTSAGVVALGKSALGQALAQKSAIGIVADLKRLAQHK